MSIIYVVLSKKSGFGTALKYYAYISGTFGRRPYFLLYLLMSAIPLAIKIYLLLKYIANYRLLTLPNLSWTGEV